MVNKYNNKLFFFPVSVNEKKALKDSCQLWKDRLPEKEESEDKT